MRDPVSSQRAAYLRRAIPRHRRCPRHRRTELITDRIDVSTAADPQPVYINGRTYCPRCRNEPRPVIRINFADGQTTGPLVWHSLDEFVADEPIGWPTHWGTPSEPRRWWRRLFRR